MSNGEGPIHCNIDIETFSSVDISKGGLYKYVRSADFSLLLFAFAVNFGPVFGIDLTAERYYDDPDFGSGYKRDPLPLRVLNLLFDDNTILHAYNAAFEWYCLSHYLGLSKTQAYKWLKHWRCTMLHGMYLGYPAGLGACGTALGLPQDRLKDRAGKALIQYFCKPCEATLENGYRTRNLPQHDLDRWQQFREYNVQDVVAEMAIEKALSAFPVPESVQKEWELDQIINERGVMTDRDLVDGAITLSSENTAELMDEAVKLTGLDNPNSRAQLVDWLTAETGENVTTLRKTDVDELLEKDLSSTAVVRMLEIRRELAKTSISKYTAIQNAACDDGRVRGSLMFYGAVRTGRWAGRLIQPQNFPRTHITEIDYARSLVRDCKARMIRTVYGSITDTLSQLIRTALIPAEGKSFIDADFSAIEARVVAWLAGENWVLEVFRTHGKIYEATAAQMFNIPIEKIVKGQPEYELRQKGKIATLALGYGGGTGALINMGALKMGIPEDSLQDIVDRWRNANRNIVALWKNVQTAVLDTLMTGQPHTIPRLAFALKGDGTRAWMVITLPSGRELFYPRPHLTKDQWGRDSFAYYGGNGFGEVEAWGGKLVENIVQAVARDCLAESIQKLEAAGFNIVFHVHDEVIIEAENGQTLNAVCNIMSQPPSWADGLPLRADGWTGNYYTKD